MIYGLASFDTSGAAAGLDASRRVAWARFYALQEKYDGQERRYYRLMAGAARMVLLVLRDEALAILEPDGETRTAACRLLTSIRLQAYGPEIIATVEQELDAE